MMSNVEHRISSFVRRMSMYELRDTVPLLPSYSKYTNLEVFRYQGVRI